jgi:subtilisin family serine protease
MAPAPAPAKAHAPRRRKHTPRYAPDVVVVTYRANSDRVAQARVEQKYALSVDRKVTSRYFVRYFIGARAKAAGETVESVAASLARDPGVKAAEPDYAITPDQALPNDPRFGEMWGLHNTGQSGGTADADIDAPEAWAAIPAGPEVRVAVLDDGVEYTHPDLAGNIWTNPGEIPNNGIDDDGNGYVDDVRGWDTADNDNNPAPSVASDSHGTHVAGTVAAVTNNGIGVAGVGKRIKVIPIRMYAGQSTWMTSLANGIDYARIAGAKVLNVSYNTDDFTSFLMDAIVRAQNADIVYVGSSGNNGENMDAYRGRMKQFANNIMFVAATDRNDRLADFSNYGKTTDIAAPGVSILSTVTGGGYEFYDGTSMATPHVAAVAGVVRAMYPSLTYAQVIARLNGSADYKAALLDRISGGRLNLANAIEADSIAPSSPTMPVLTARTSVRLRLRFGGAGDDGATGSASRYEIRLSDSPIQAGNFSAARLGAIVPGGAAGEVVAEVAGLLPGRSQYVAVRAFDNVGNASTVAAAGPFATRAPAWGDDMEGAVQWTGQAGKTWTLTTGAANSGTKAWEDSPGGNYAANEDSALIYNGNQPINGPMFLRFAARLDIEKDYDFLYVDVSTDGGANWTNVNRLTGTDLQWRNYGAIVSGSGTRNVKIRFRLVTDSEVQQSGVSIDDVSLTPAALLFEDKLENGAGNWTTGAWTLSDVLSMSPTHAWNDSPFGDYPNNATSTLAKTAAVNVAGYADVTFNFAAWYKLELDYDFLDVYFVQDGGSPAPIGSLNGDSAGWAWVSIPVTAQTSFRPFFVLASDESFTDEGVCLDDLSVYGEAWENAAVVTASLGLDGYVGTGRGLIVEIRNPATQAVLETYALPVSRGASGAPRAIFSTFRAGSYTVAIRGETWLRALRTATFAPGEVALQATLVNGDADGDNRITTTDFAIVNRAFGKAVGQAGYEARADLNGDGVVNAADVEIVQRNQRKRGEN